MSEMQLNPLIVRKLIVRFRENKDVTQTAKAAALSRALGLGEDWMDAFSRVKGKMESRCGLLNTFISPAADYLLICKNRKITFRPDSSIIYSRQDRKRRAGKPRRV